VALNGTVVRVPSAFAHKDYDPAVDRHPGTTNSGALLCVPIPSLCDKQCLGAIQVFAMDNRPKATQFGRSNNAHGFSDEDEQLLLEIAALAASAISNAVKGEEFKQDIQRSEVLMQLAAELCLKPGMASTVDFIVDTMLRHMKAEIAELWLLDEYQGNLCRVGTSSKVLSAGPPRLKIGQSWIGNVAQVKATTNSWSKALPQPSSKATIFAPIYKAMWYSTNSTCLSFLGLLSPE